MLQRLAAVLAALDALPPTLSLLAALMLLASGARAQDTARGNTSAATISGTVYDSLTAKPLAGALVQLVAKGPHASVSSATSGAQGEFEIAGVPAGSYIIGFFHPTLDSLGLGVAPRPLEIAGATPIHVGLAIPSAGTVRNLLCPPGSNADSSGLMIGFVRDADTGIPLAGATIVVMWTELVIKDGIRADRREIPVKANDEGWYALCGMPSDGPITARAELGRDASGFIEISVPPRGVRHRDFGIPRDSAVVTVAVDDSSGAGAAQTVRRGSSRLTGIVRDERGKPLSGVQLLVWGSGVTGSTLGDGTFTLSGLPAGSQALEARYVGYAPERVTVDLVSHATRSVTVTLAKHVGVLGEVTIYGKPSPLRRDFLGFLQRRKGGFGHFLTRADIEKRHPFEFTDLFRMIPGFRVVPTSNAGFGHTILSTRGASFSGPCKPAIYLDGVKLIGVDDIDGLVMPSDIAAVEAYAGPAGAPLQYTSGFCGSILVWTGPDSRVTQD